MKHFFISLIVSLFLFQLSFAADRGQNEGITTVINPSDLEPLKEWIHNAKQDLERGLKEAKLDSILMQETKLRQLTDEVMSRADKRTTEFLMRNVLYRAQDVHDYLMTLANEPKRNSFARRFLIQSVKWAITLAETDEALLKNINQTTFDTSPERAIFGLIWTYSLAKISFSLPTNEAHFEVLKMSMGYLYNDIVRDDQFNRKLAPIAATLLKKKQDMNLDLATSPLVKLELIKDLRQTILDETMRGLEILKPNVANVFKDLVQKNLKPNQEIFLNFDQCSRTAFSIEMNHSCYLDFKSSITFSQCTDNARDDSMRAQCFDDFKTQITFKQCTDNASLMSYKLGSSMRVLCYYYFKTQITFEQCTDNARHMSYKWKNPMREQCYIDFKTQITFEQCIENANEMQPSYSKDSRALMRGQCQEDFKSQ